MGLYSARTARPTGRGNRGVIPRPSLGVSTMSHEKTTTKEPKKKPAHTLKEKRAAKKEKASGSKGGGLGAPIKSS